MNIYRKHFCLLQRIVQETNKMSVMDESRHQERKFHNRTQNTIGKRMKTKKIVQFLVEIIRTMLSEMTLGTMRWIEQDLP